jgi:cytochrome P450
MPSATYNPYDPAVRDDPYPTYHRLRGEDPVHFNRYSGMWFLTGHENCSAVLRDRRFSAEHAQAVRPGLPQAARSMLNTDPPEHTRLRAPLSSAFSARGIEPLRPEIQRLADRLLDERPYTDRLDVIADLAEPLSIQTLAVLLAVPTTDLALFHQLAQAASAVLDPLAPAGVQRSAEAAAEALEDYLARILDTSTVAAAVRRAGGLSPDEMLMAADLIVIGGYQPTAHLIGNAVLALLRHPDQLDSLRQAPSPPAPAVTELVRHDSPIQFTTRIARCDVHIGHRTVREGQRVVCLLGAANRDPAAFPDPDRLHLARTPNAHIAFGAGAHYCLGAILARVVTQTAIGALLRAFPRWELTDDKQTWRSVTVPRGLDSLVIRA